MKIVELFSGIGSQAKAFSRLGVPFEVVATCEWDIHAIVAYDLIHNGPAILTNENQVSKQELSKRLQNTGLSNNGKSPMTDRALKSMDKSLLSIIHSAIERTKNHVDITKLKGEDLPDVIDIMTYSFPCQDLSNVGAFHGYNKGIDRNSNTRSGMLWEVERILKERVNANQALPEILLLENVSALLAEAHSSNFDEWKSILNDLGYENHVYRLNASDFGLPQNRLRLLMLSFKIHGEEDAKLIKKYFKQHNLEKEEYRNTLNIKQPNLADYLRVDYDVKIYKKEAEECQPNDTESRRRIWEENLQITDLDKRIIADKVATITTKQDRHPNSGNLYFPYNGKKGKSSFRYLTPRECMLLMGFDEADYEALVTNPIKLRDNQLLFSRDKIIRLAGNSIAVGILEYVFKQIIELRETLIANLGKESLDTNDSVPKN